MQIASLFIQGTIGAIFLVLSFLIKRVVDENDKNHKEAIRRHDEAFGSIRTISNRLEGLEKSINYLEIEFRDRISKGNLGRENTIIEEIKKIKTQISSSEYYFKEIQTTVDKIIPKIARNTEKYKDISWLKKELELQKKRQNSIVESLKSLLNAQKQSP